MSVVHEKPECVVEMPLTSPYTSKILKSVDLRDVVPSLLTSEDVSDDSSLMKLPDSDSSTDDHEEDSKAEGLMHSSPSKNYHSITNIKFNLFNSNESDGIQTTEELVDKTITISSEDSIEEYPLFNHHELLNNKIIEDEFRLSSPEKPLKEEQFVLERVLETKISTKKSRIPVLTSANPKIRRSKRLIEANLEPFHNQCTPKKLSVVLKPSIKKNLSTLNFIVNSSSGELHDATKYATEINAANSEGILIPNNPNELVSIPVLGTRLAAKTNKLAYVRAYQYSHTSINNSFTNLGFYTEEQHKKYFSTDESPAKIAKITKPKHTSPEKQKKLRWANELEW